VLPPLSGLISAGLHPALVAQDAFIPTDRETGRSRGFGFVTMASGSDQAIQNLNETEFGVRACVGGVSCRW
jgi:RNA recognition motif-containing protein